MGLILCVGLATLAWASSALAAAEGLVGWWRFDSAGPQVADLSGKGHAATLTGGEIVVENGKRVLRLDGRTRIQVPSAPDLNLRRGFSIEARVRPTDLADGRTVVFKNAEYMVRIDWPKEGSRLSFFANLEGAWEPRVSAFKPRAGTWYHLVAVWDGMQSYLWVNGLPYQVRRPGSPPPATDNPVEIGSPLGYGAGFVGEIEQVKLYSRALTSAEVIKAAYGLGEGAGAAPVAAAAFDFREGVQGWMARDGATISRSRDGMAIATTSPSAAALHDHLRVKIDDKDYLSVRLSVDRGSRAQVIFATTQGAARLPLQVYADGVMHTYVLEPWQYPGWGGELLALGIAPSDADQARACLESVRLGSAPEGGGEVQLLSLYPESVLPRAGRPERVVARLVNVGAPTAKVRAGLDVPPGVRVLGRAEQTVPTLGYQEQQEVSWRVQAAEALWGDFHVGVSGEGLASAALTTEIGILPSVHLPKASYVPEPAPAKTGRYAIWTHYCPLWKQGTHMGWKAIEPYPGRKPVLGWYNEGTPEVADWHIKYWLEHGISAVIYCWYRSNLNAPVTQSLGHAIHDGLLKARYLPRIEFAIMWENGCGQGVGSREDLMRNVLPFWLDHYFTHPSYLKVDGKPVLYVWVPPNVTRHLGGSEQVRETFEAMREQCRRRGLAGLYLVGCVGGADREALAQMAKEGWDASSAYGNGWSTPAEVRQRGNFTCAPMEGFIEQQEAIWKAKTGFGLLPDITAAMMGWDSRPWNETPFFWSENTPGKFRDLCRRAKAAMDAKTTTGPERNTTILCCWNEFGEGHYIEPTRGYGFSYLDAIREVFTDAPREHTDLAPEDVGLGPYDSWYRQARAAGPVSEVSPATSWTGAGLAAWTGFMGLENWKVGAGGIRAVSSTSDPALSSPMLKVRARRFSKVIVEMRVSPPGDAQLFWNTVSMSGMNESASLHVTTVADGQFHRYAYEVGRSEYWGGCVTGLRFDPATAAGVTIEIRAIELQ